MLQVLLVDDEIAVTDSMQRGIDWAALGLHVAAVAMSGMQALKFIHANPVDIVITDIRMADMDGLSLCQRIFQLNRNILHYQIRPPHAKAPYRMLPSVMFLK